MDLCTGRSSLPAPEARSGPVACSPSGNGGDKLRVGYLEPAVTERGTQGWRLVVDDLDPKQVIGAKSIAPLVRLGLLEPDPATPGHLTVSARDRTTWDHFLQADGQFSEDDAPSLIETTDPDTVH